MDHSAAPANWDESRPLGQEAPHLEHDLEAPVVQQTEEPVGEQQKEAPAVVQKEATRRVDIRFRDCIRNRRTGAEEDDAPA